MVKQTGSILFVTAADIVQGADQTLRFPHAVADRNVG